MSTVTAFLIHATVTVPVAIYDTVFFHVLFYSTHVPMFTVLDPVLEFSNHLLSSLTQIFIMYPIFTVYALPFRVAAMPAVRYDLNGGLSTCLWYDSLYIRIIWLLVCLWNVCKPDMVPVSIYFELNLSESESESNHDYSYSSWLIYVNDFTWSHQNTSVKRVEILHYLIGRIRWVALCGVMECIDHVML